MGEAKTRGTMGEAKVVWPANVLEVSGDVLDASERYLCHQCNCVTSRGKHLSAAADIYSERSANKSRGIPGTIILRGNESKKQRLVVNILGQLYPGLARYANDTKALRIRWFRSCLDEIAKLPNLESLAFPHKIGCGAAGGDWTLYSAMLADFASKNPAVRIAIYPSTFYFSFPSSTSYFLMSGKDEKKDADGEALGVAISLLKKREDSWFRARAPRTIF